MKYRNKIKRRTSFFIVIIFREINNMTISNYYVLTIIAGQSLTITIKQVLHNLKELVTSFTDSSQFGEVAI